MCTHVSCLQFLSVNMKVIFEEEKTLNTESFRDYLQMNISYYRPSLRLYHPALPLSNSCIKRPGIISDVTM